MIDFKIEQHVPRFVMKDKNGYALAKSIEAALKPALKAVKGGVSIMTDVDAMPEWRLDELAWEYNCLYDFAANIETKRRWIRDALPIYRIYGTPRAIYQYLEGVFDDIELEEWWQFNGDLFHFRVTVSGAWTNEKEAWARKAIETAKNVRSVMDSIAIGSRCFVKVHGEGNVITRFPYQTTSPALLSGTIPNINFVGKTSEGVIVLTTDARAHVYEYPLAGTRPEINTLGALRNSSIIANGDACGYVYPYRQSGTNPINTIVGKSVDGGIRASPDGSKTKFHYVCCGEGLCGDNGL